jgi:hypothetical protein
MADLDLLVDPESRGAMAELLERLGYRQEHEKNPRPTHDTFINPGAGKIVERGEHVDNPRRVEVHTEVMRHLWGWIESDELTPALWRGATPGILLGEPAWLPAEEDLAAHLAIHASSDLLVGRGRLVQWLDFVTVVHALNRSMSSIPHPSVAYPALGLAYRALPRLGDLDLSPLTPGLPRKLVAWVENVPINDRCGLLVAGALPVPSSVRARWKRWAPYRWRMAVAYGDVPMPVALRRHYSMLAGHARRANASRA